MVRCARDGCGHRVAKHTNGTGACRVNPAGHCTSFVEAAPPPPPAKAVMKGMFTRSSYGVPNAAGPLTCLTYAIDHADVEKTKGQRNWTLLDNALAGAQTAGFKSLRLRIYCGARSAPWVFAIDSIDGLIEPQNGSTFSIPNVWDPTIQAVYRDLFADCATRYDSEPFLSLAFASGASTFYAEPFMRQSQGTGVAANAAKLYAAGYTPDKDKALEKAQFDWMTGFKRTNVACAFNPWQYFDAAGNGKADAAFTIECMDYQASLFGGRTVLQNNSIKYGSSGWPPPPPQYVIMYDAMKARPYPKQYQLGNAHEIGDEWAAANWAIDTLAASGLEKTGTLTTAQYADLDARLKAA